VEANYIAMLEGVRFKSKPKKEWRREAPPFFFRLISTLVVHRAVIGTNNFSKVLQSKTFEKLL